TPGVAGSSPVRSATLLETPAVMLGFFAFKVLKYSSLLFLPLASFLSHVLLLQRQKYTALKNEYEKADT
ncbi:hypothetical protein L9W80_17725, partial [Vibrio aestuarianus]|uniref:hypothetical protein n=1 Tax=Vibrio aestuarianus TaxID=28171 RepID=UPI00237D1BF4